MSNILMLFILHVIGDFYLQNEEMATKKGCLNIQMITHSLCYVFPFMIGLLFGLDFFTIMILGISHFFVDIITIEAKRKYSSKELFIFFVDQLIHLMIITIYSINVELSIMVSLKTLTAILSLLILWKPVGIIISMAFNLIFKKAVPIGDKDETKIGRYIGYLERTIIFILCSMGAVSTIGFILTAKTLVRYKDITNNEDHFQEKYLIGTLLSTIGALCCYMITNLV